MAPAVKGQAGSDLDRTYMSDLKRTDPSDLDWTNMSGPYKEELREKYKENKVRESNRARPRGLPEVNAYFLSLGATKKAAMVFYSQYETTGWTLATGQPIVNWKARAWKWLISLYKFFSPIHLLKEPFANDSNSLNKEFYRELLYILGLEETKEGYPQPKNPPPSSGSGFKPLIEN